MVDLLSEKPEMMKEKRINNGSEGSNPYFSAQEAYDLFKPK